MAMDGGPPQTPGAGNGVYKRPHPLVGGALGSMGAELKSLQDQTTSNKKTKRDIADIANEATADMNGALGVRHAIMMKEAELRSRDVKLSKLEAETARIEKTHARLHEKLHEIMDKKVLFSKQRLEKRQEALGKSDTLLKAWTTQDDMHKAAALNKLHEKSAAMEALQEASRSLEEARLKEEAVEKQYHFVRKQTTQEVQAYRYVDAKREAAQSREAEDASRVEREQHSLEKMSDIAVIEDRRINESLAVSEARLEKRLGKATAAKEQTNIELQTLGQQYAQFQAVERGRMEKAAKQQAEYDAGLEASTKERSRLFDEAQARGAKAAESTNDWADDDWAWTGRQHKADAKPGDEEEDPDTIKLSAAQLAEAADAGV